MTSKIGFMQGRLCDQVDGKIQAFPWNDWEDEFSVAESINLSVMEWTIDKDKLYENPLMTKEGQRKISALSSIHHVAIPSLTGDCFMQAPFWKTSADLESELQKDFLAVCDACSALRIEMIVIPLVDDGCLENSQQEDRLVDFLLSHEKPFEQKNIKILFESDFEPLNLKRFIDRLPSDSFGINYDIGNSAALGFEPRDEFAAYGSRIVNVHVKDRVRGGTTVPLGSGSADFELVFSELKNAKYFGNYILQSARAGDGDHAGVIAKYRDMVLDWVAESKHSKEWT